MNNKLSKIKSIQWVMLLSIGVFLSGCTGMALKSSFQEISETHATLTDEQMLLNLARRANFQAAHFLQMSSVNASFSFGATVGGSATYSRTLASIVTKVFSYVGDFTLSATESPTFSFAPLSGSSFAKTAYNPIDTTVFFEQLRQGVPVNQLMRMLVVSVVLEYPTGKKMVLTNIPDEGRPENFRNFLRLSGLARQLQLAQSLRIETKGKNNIISIPKEALPVLTSLYKDPKYAFWQDSLMSIGIEDGTPVISIVMRPFSGVLGALGESQSHFKKWLETGIDLDDIPETERQPILTLIWDEEDEDKITPPTAEIEYLDVDYQIADLIKGKQLTWNRESFRILNDLFTIISLDAKDLPVQQLIKVF
ncbi:MAG TPA: hypothetical protein EYG48_02985 [Methylococcales bacterium]|nr:hypothetical protein [Methylococcales bacterium]